LFGLRLTHELQIPASKDQTFTDRKGNLTTVKGDTIASGNYLTSEGKQGDSAWSTRAAWCKVYGIIDHDSVSITIFDHPGNPNYPTFWHARGYGLFAANPLGEKIFTNGKSSFNLHLKKGGSVRFHYRILIQNGRNTPGVNELNRVANEFSKD
jgi:Methane oxygenase PmoA